MTDGEGVKAELHHYFRQGREALLWKLDGVPEYDARRPLTPTGTNLLGLVKHTAIVVARAHRSSPCSGTPTRTPTRRSTRSRSTPPATCPGGPGP